MRETYLPRTPGLVADRAWVGTPCETWTGAPFTPCGKPSTCRYPAMGGGWHHMCAAHGARHGNIIEHADGRQGRLLTGPAWAKAARGLKEAPPTDQLWRRVLLATPTSEASAVTSDDIARALQLPRTRVAPVLTKCVNAGAVRRTRTDSAATDEWRWWRDMADSAITRAKSLRRLAAAGAGA